MRVTKKGQSPYKNKDGSPWYVGRRATCMTCGEESILEEGDFDTDEPDFKEVGPGWLYELPCATCERVQDHHVEDLSQYERRKRLEEPVPIHPLPLSKPKGKRRFGLWVFE